MFAALLVVGVFMANITNDTAEWTPASLPWYNTMTEAQKAGKELEGGRWIWWRQAPGDGKRCARYVCNAHQDCKKMMQVKLYGGCGFQVELMGKHSEEVNLYPRKNSALTFDARARLKEGTDSGSKPAGVLSSMTKAERDKLKARGEDPLDHKRAGGGLEGALCERACTSVYYACLICVQSCTNIVSPPTPATTVATYVLTSIINVLSCTNTVSSPTPATTVATYVLPCTIAVLSMH